MLNDITYFFDRGDDYDGDLLFHEKEIFKRQRQLDEFVNRSNDRKKDWIKILWSSITNLMFSAR